MSEPQTNIKAEEVPPTEVPITAEATESTPAQEAPATEVETTVESTTEVPAEPTSEEPKEKEEPYYIEEGIVHKRGPLPLRLWQKRFMSFSHGKNSYPLYDLRFVYRKNVKKSQALKEEFEKANKFLLETIATATVNANDIIVYYKTGSKDELPQGLINLRHITSVEAAPKIKPFAFILKTKARDYVFNANNKKELDGWINSINAKINTEIPDFSDTEGYKFTYDHIVNRKGFLPPASAPAENDEVFSASEAEFEGEEATQKSSNEPASEQTEAQPATTEANQPAGKSFLNEVLSIFYSKGGEADVANATKPVTESEAKPAEEAPAAETAAPEPTSVEEPETKEEPAPEAEKAVETPEATETKARSPRTKTFSFSGFQGGKFLSIFGKSGKEEAKPETSNEAAQAQEVAKEEAKEDAPEGEEATETPEAVPVAETTDAAIETSAPQVEEPASPKAKEKQPNFLTRMFSINKAKPTEEGMKGEAKAEEPAPAEEVPVTEETKAEEAPIAEEVKVEEATEEAKEAELPEPEAEKKEVSAIEKKGNFFSRILSKRKPTSPTDAEEKAEAVEAEKPEEVKEEGVSAAEETKPEETVPAAASEEPVAAEVSEEPAAEEQTLPEAHVSEAAVEEVKAEEPVAEVAEPVVEADVPVQTEEPVAEETIETLKDAAEPVAVGTAAEATSEATSEATPARQASLIARIGGYAMSAVSPTSPHAEEINEEISEHYKELAKDAAYSGFLFKQSYLLHSNNHRYVILGKEGLFVYYRNAQTVSDGKNIIINENVIIAPTGEQSFTIKTPSQTYTFSAHTAEERDNWVAQLSKFSKKEEAEVSEEAALPEISEEATTSAEATDKVEDEAAPAEETKENTTVQASA